MRGVTTSKIFRELISLTRTCLRVPLVAAFFAVFALACGTNNVSVEIKGGDGTKVRFDANSLEFGRNSVVDAGSFSFSDIKRGTYTVNVVAGSYHGTHTFVIESAPIAGTENFRHTFQIPKGSNTSFNPEGTILFSSTRTTSRNWDLFTIKADGTERTQLTSSAEPEQHGVWSPDGSQIAFTQGDVLSNIDIYVMRADATNLRRLTEHAERDQRPAWSPDGSLIAFVTQREGEVEVWLVDPRGGSLRRLVKGREPSWSPDGEIISFVGQMDGNDEIYTIKPDGSDLRRLTDQKKFDWFPAWSPSGNRMAFCSERFGGQELMIANADGSGQTRITVAEKTYEQEPEWSPDGKGLAYAGNMNGDYEIYLIGTHGFDLDEHENPVLPQNLTESPDRDDKSPSWRAF